MRAAVELARDGHDVVLLERGPALGGQLLDVRRVPGRETVDLLLQDLTRDLSALGVDVRLGVDATADTIRAEGADEVVIATGARAPHRTSLSAGSAWVNGVPDDAVDAFAALADPAALGRRVVVVDSDGTAYASGVVLSLLGADREVEVVTPFESLFPHVGSGYDRQLLLERLGSQAFRRRASTSRRRGRRASSPSGTRSRGRGTSFATSTPWSRSSRASRCSPRVWSAPLASSATRWHRGTSTLRSSMPSRWPTPPVGSGRHPASWTSSAGDRNLRATAVARACAARRPGSGSAVARLGRNAMLRMSSTPAQPSQSSK